MVTADDSAMKTYGLLQLQLMSYTMDTVNMAYTGIVTSLQPRAHSKFT